MKVIFIKIKLIELLFGLFLIIPISAQSNISLLETEKVKDYLSLSSQQSEKINPMIEQIRTILEEDRKIISKIKERVKNDDEPGFFEKIGIKRGRDSRTGDIEYLIEEIKNQLNDYQKIKFENIEKPGLKALKKEDVLGK